MIKQAFIIKSLKKIIYESEENQLLDKMEEDKKMKIQEIEKLESDLEIEY